ncbi:hypothetical protein [Demequina litorisediminis]|uniref:hypothetical protein n=1 Tax=Demequina litorisediminis TaxID=1849022 RepID=UPI0024E0A0DC|nr:hypothetical protein [Demequina litorisediminis]
MDSAQRRALGLVAVAAWLLIDSLRTAGPLLLDLSESGPAPAALAAVATAAGAALIAWIASETAKHLGHGGTVAFLISVVAVFRLALPVLSGTWLIGAGLYLLALALAAVVMTARVALGNGGGSALLAGTSLGAGAALAEQALLRTFDAPWRQDEWGWNALAVVAVLAIVNGIRCRDLEPAPSSRGWWAYGLYWAGLLFGFANLAWINVQADVRMSGGLILGMLGAVLGAHLASQSTALTVPLRVTILGLGAVAAAVAFLTTGTTAAIAIPVAAAAAALGAALAIRPADVAPAARFGATLVFIAAVLAPLALTTIDRFAEVPLAAEAVMAVTVIAVIIGGGVRGWDLARGTALGGVWLRVGVFTLLGAGLAGWTWNTYEQPRAFTMDFLTEPIAMTWNVHQGIAPTDQGGPAIRLDDIATEPRDGRRRHASRSRSRRPAGWRHRHGRVPRGRDPHGDRLRPGGKRPGGQRDSDVARPQRRTHHRVARGSRRPRALSARHRLHGSDLRVRTTVRRPGRCRGRAGGHPRLGAGWHRGGRGGCRSRRRAGNRGPRLLRPRHAGGRRVGCARSRLRHGRRRGDRRRRRHHRPCRDARRGRGRGDRGVRPRPADRQGHSTGACSTIPRTVTGPSRLPRQARAHRPPPRRRPARATARASLTPWRRLPCGAGAAPPRTPCRTATGRR